ncbi:MAG: nucleotidyltransferase domain-containing protein [Patescibacteria group bacterium]
MEKNTAIKEIIKIIRKYLSDDYRIFLFGSWARGDASETSDIDIGILGKEKVVWSIMVKILEDVDNIPTLRKIDVIDFKTKDESFRKSSLSYAKVLS